MGHLKDGQREVWFCVGGRAATGLLSWCPCSPGLTCTGRLSGQAPAARSYFHWVGHRGSHDTNLEEAQVSTALLSAAPTSLHTHCPMALSSGREQPLAWSDLCLGLHLGLLAHLPLASGRRATCSGSHQGGEGRGTRAKTNRPSNLVHRLVLEWLLAGRDGVCV